MGDFSRSTFDRLKHYVGVRLQQGVPLLDADWNELEDIRRYEVQAFLKWFVGDGVPAGNDGFRIAALPGVNNDFTIAGGDGTPDGAGRCLVDGRDAVVESSLAYTAQPLFGNPALATAWAVPPLPALSPPGSGTRTDLVYLDVWDREVTSTEDSALVNALIGVETAVRLRREWTVRVRVAAVAVPGPADADFTAGHSYLALATLTRQVGVAAIAATALSDLRGQNLQLAPSTLIEDVLGTDVDTYRRGGNRPQLSLRDTINALLAGRAPGGDELPVGAGAGLDVLDRASVVDAAGGLVVVWHATRAPNPNQVFVARYDPAHPELGFTAAGPITSGSRHQAPAAVALPNGDLLVAYQNGTTDNAATDVRMRRGPLAGLAAAPEVDVAATTGNADQDVRAVLVNDQVVFFTLLGISQRQWFYRRYRHTDQTFVDAAGPVALSAAALTPQDLHAAAAGGVAWVAYADGTKLQLLRLNPQDPVVIDAKQGLDTTASNVDGFVLALSGSEAMVSYADGGGLSVASFSNGGWTTARVPGTDASDSQPALVRQSDGTLLLVSARAVTSSGSDIVLRRRDAGSNQWGTPQRVASSLSTANGRLHPIFAPSLGLWVLWATNQPGNPDVHAKPVITAI